MVTWFMRTTCAGTAPLESALAMTTVSAEFARAGPNSSLCNPLLRCPCDTMECRHSVSSLMLPDPAVSRSHHLDQLGCCLEADGHCQDSSLRLRHQTPCSRSPLRCSTMLRCLAAGTAPCSVCTSRPSTDKPAPGSQLTSTAGPMQAQQSQALRYRCSCPRGARPPQTTGVCYKGCRPQCGEPRRPA